MMFNQYDYFDGIRDYLPQELADLHRITGLRELEETLENIRNLKEYVFLVEDDDDGFLSFTQGNFDNGFYTFHIVGRVKVNSSTDRVRVKKNCMALALLVFKKMMADAQNFGDAAYGFDRSRVDYRQLGPLINNYYGYSFSYVMRDENFKLEIDGGES
jgi:hypothetical protein